MSVATTNMPDRTNVSNCKPIKIIRTEMYTFPVV